MDKAEVNNANAPYCPPDVVPFPISDPHKYDDEWLLTIPDEGDPFEDEILQFAHRTCSDDLPFRSTDAGR